MRAAFKPLLPALLPALLALAACGEPAAAPEGDATQALAAETDRVSRVLRARHANDMMTTVAPNEHTEAALLACSREDALLVVRVRAIAALAAHPSQATRRRILELLTPDKAHPALRAAAAEAAVALAPEPGSELWEALGRLRDDPDPRVQLALANWR